jgi:hypothetical protein
LIRGRGVDRFFGETFRVLREKEMKTYVSDERVMKVCKLIIKKIK